MEKINGKQMINDAQAMWGLKNDVVPSHSNLVALRRFLDGRPLFLSTFVFISTTEWYILKRSLFSIGITYIFSDVPKIKTELETIEAFILLQLSCHICFQRR